MWDGQPCAAIAGISGEGLDYQPTEPKRWSPSPALTAGVPGARRTRTGSPGPLPRLPAALHTAAAQALKGVQAQPACVRDWLLHAARLVVRWSVG